MTRHRVTASSLGYVWLALVVLAALSFGLSFANLGRAASAVALTIAVVKAAMIAAFFMHLVEQPSVSRWALAVGVFLMLLLVGFVALDVLTRDQTGLVQPGL